MNITRIVFCTPIRLAVSLLVFLATAGRVVHNDPSHVDYVPTVFAYNSKSFVIVRSQVSLPTCGTGSTSERSERLKKRKLYYLQERSTIN